GAVGVRMRVPVVGLAVRRPARVADADGPLHPARQRRLEPGDLAGRLVDLQPTARVHGDARGVVAPVLEAMEPGEEDRDRLSAADGAHDTAQGSPSLSAIDEPTDLALAQRRRREAPLPELPGEALEDVLVAELLRLELAMPAHHELLDRFGEVGEQLVDQPGE